MIKGYREHQPLLQQLIARTKLIGDCFVWQGAKAGKGYGVVSIDAKSVKVHRLIWQLSYGDIPSGLGVLHRCDNPSCVNIDHLFLGTSQDNTRDAMMKGRFRPSEVGKLARPKLKMEPPLSYRPSSTTDVLSLRLPNEVLNLLKRRADKQGMLVSNYTRKRLVYDTLRKHKKKGGDTNG